MLPNNNVNEDITMIVNSSGFFPVKTRKNFKLSTIHLLVRESKHINTETKMEWKNLTQRLVVTHAQISELARL
jgi:hypothetical protein